MKRMTHPILAAVLVASIGCGVIKSVIWPATVTCGAPMAGALVDEIKQLVLTGGADWERALEQLAAENGPGLVTCILSQLIDNWLPANGMRASARDAAAARRAQGFLNDRQVTVRESTAQ